MKRFLNLIIYLIFFSFPLGSLYSDLYVQLDEKYTAIDLDWRVILDFPVKYQPFVNKNNPIFEILYDESKEITLRDPYNSLSLNDANTITLLDENGKFTVVDIKQKIILEEFAFGKDLAQRFNKKFKHNLYFKVLLIGKNKRVWVPEQNISLPDIYKDIFISANNNGELDIIRDFIPILKPEDFFKKKSSFEYDKNLLGKYGSIDFEAREKQYKKSLSKSSGVNSEYYVLRSDGFVHYQEYAHNGYTNYFIVDNFNSLDDLRIFYKQNLKKEGSLFVNSQSEIGEEDDSDIKNNNNLDIYENILNKQYVSANKLNVRNKANGKIIGSVFKNDKLAIMANTGSWSKIITKNGLKGWVSNQYLSEEQILVVKDKLPLSGNQNNYKYCWDFYKYKDKYNLKFVTSRKDDCLISEKEIEPFWCNDKSITDPKLLDGCKNNNSTTKIVKKNDESIKKLEIVVESDQILDEIAPQIACNEIGIIKTSLANIKCKISDDNELFAVVVNGKQIEGNLQNLNEQIQVPFGNSKIEVVAYDSFGNQENLILNVNREFSLANSQEDIERLFPGKIKDKSSKNKVAVIIGIQNYADIPDTKYSDKDAMAFAEFANQTLNISSKNIKYLFNEDAKYFGFKGIQTWLENKVNKNTDVYVFYSGHGLGVEGKSKLLPSDFVTQFQEESSYEKDEFLSDIANLNPNHIYAFFDTCFSGLGRNGETLVAGLKNISIVEEVAPVDNITIFNSSSGLEYSTDFDEAEHGLFSYYLMKGLEGNADLNSDNEITSKELFSFISDNVSDRALDIGLSQNPSLIGESNNVIVRW